MHSTGAGDVGQIHVLPTEIRSMVRVLGEQGREGKGGKGMQKESGSGAGVVGRREAVTADVGSE